MKESIDEFGFIDWSSKMDGMTMISEGVINRTRKLFFMKMAMEEKSAMRQALIEMGWTPPPERKQ